MKSIVENGYQDNIKHLTNPIRCATILLKRTIMAEMAGVHMRMTEQQITFIKAQAAKKGVNSSEFVRALIDKAIIKDAKKK